MKPLLSIVVPTKNRYFYLKHLILLVSSFKSENIELVIQDNSECNSEILNFLKDGDYFNVTYLYDSRNLSMSANADLAILHSSGEYVCFIGDDDGVTSHILSCVFWMKQNNIDALMSSQTVYYWGDYNKNISGDFSQTLLYKKYSQRVYRRDPLQALDNIMKQGFQTRGDIPLVYTGIIKRSVLDQIYSKGQTFFPGPSPDMANGVALCFLVHNFVYIDFPIVITGTSKMTGGGIHKLKGRIANIEDVPFIDRDVKNKWERRIPPIWAGRFAWPEAGIKSLRYMGHEELIEKVNYELMLADFTIYHLSYWRVAIGFSREKKRFLYYFVIRLIWKLSRGIKNMFTRKFLGKINGNIIIHDISNIEEANNYLVRLVPDFRLEIH